MDTARFRERWPNTTRTSRGICIRSSAPPEVDIETHSGEGKEPNESNEPSDGNVELGDTLVIETTDDQKYEFEIVGIVEDDDKNGFAVAYSEKADEFVVTDDKGTLLANDELAQEILDDFFVLAEESATEES